MQTELNLWKSWRLKLREKVLRMHDADFEAVALDMFQFTFAHNPLYRQYAELLQINPQSVNSLAKIPFLPIELFKNHRVQTGFAPVLFDFESSGTTGQVPSKHPVCDPEFYQQQSKRIFESAYGPLTEYHIFALLPSYLERSTSSLVFMMDYFINESGSPISGFFLNQYQELVGQIKKALQTERKIWVMGVTFGLLDWVDSGQDFSFWHEAVAQGRIVVMETGGMKGRREEWIRDRVHDFLKSSMGLQHIGSEYGMTELFSQAYAASDGIFTPGVSMRIQLREVTDPFAKVTKPGRVGGIQIIDLANIDSCPFIETRDLGSMEEDGLRFKVLGRFDNSEIRGCNLMVDQGWGTSQAEPSV